MRETRTAHIKPYIQPFERQLALLEMGAVARGVPVPVDGTADDALVFQVSTQATAQSLADRLAYWESIENGNWFYTAQALYEATSSRAQRQHEFRDLLPIEREPLLPNRRCLRYGTHGLHEYRGKFFPQLVRALFNIAQLRARDVIADPMCGSGTAIVEGVTGGFLSIGSDINPLSVMMTRTKAALIKVRPKVLQSTYSELRRRLQRKSPRSSDLVYFENLPARDKEYLRRWFSANVLGELDVIAQAIEDHDASPVQALLWLSLSNILRSVSWQKVDDLRVRREFRSPEPDVRAKFIEDLERSVRMVAAFQQQFANRRAGAFVVEEADARSATGVWQAYRGSVSAVVTSPPYATALPYLDTDRLSLSYLGLLSRTSHRQRDQEMIGNREVTDRLRREYWARFGSTASSLPSSVVRLVNQVHTLNAGENVGFRRRNLAALLAKYFFDMQEVLTNIRSLLRPGGHAFIVIGDNSTIAGVTRISIQTSRLLGDIAEGVGFDAVRRIPMEMLASRDIFRRNAMPSETILHLKLGYR